MGLGIVMGWDLGGIIKEGKRSTAAVVDWRPAPSLKISAVFPWSTIADCSKCGPNRLKACFDVQAVSSLFPGL